MTARTTTPTAEPAWRRMVRRRLLAGEAITGGQIRRDVGRHVTIYTFLRQLEQREGWIFKQTLVDGYPTPIVEWRLIGRREPPAPSATGPRCDVPKDSRPTEVIMRRLLRGEELENKAVADELQCTPSAVTYVRHRLESMGYDVLTRRVGYRVFTKVKKGKA